MECTNHIAIRLYGYYVELASQKRSSYIVGQILDSRSRLALDLVVSELVECGGGYVVEAGSECVWELRCAKGFESRVERE